MPKPGEKVGRYVLVEKLGAGGLGEVWKARDPRLNRVVALKFLTGAKRGVTAVHELLREARAAGSLNHPNIVTVHEVGESESTAWLVMEFVEGETLRAHMGARLPLDDVLGIATQALTGISAAHLQGIVHRDLKPENIMVRTDGLIKVMDFGLARQVPWAAAQAREDGPTVTAGTPEGTLTGTYAYMSPEQARGQAAGPASDVFSFGILLYEMLSGQHPFRRASVADTLSAILTHEPPSAPGPTEIVQRSLRKQVVERFSTAGEMNSHLQQYRTGTAAAAAVAPVVAEARLQWGIWRAVVIAVIVALLGAGGWFGWKMERGRSASVRSIAVRSFKARADEKLAATLAEGLMEEIGAALSRSGLRVASEAILPEIAQAGGARAIGGQFGVDAVLTGSVRVYGRKSKVHVELASTQTSFQIFSQTFSMEMEDWSGQEQQTAEEIVARIREAVAAYNTGKQGDK